jgi:undecaprenyl-diphosphatase
MLGLRRSLPLSRLIALDWALCLRMNRAGRTRWVREFMSAVSRLGNGGFWVGVMAMCLLLEGSAALPTLARGIGTSLACYGVYAVLKHKTARPRPYAVSVEIDRRAEPLDWYSFPSGHTMQAVALTAVLVSGCPMLAWLLVPFTVLVALSRVVVGLHYPSDVAAGAMLGGLLGTLCLSL